MNALPQPLCICFSVLHAVDTVSFSLHSSCPMSVGASSSSPGAGDVVTFRIKVAGSEDKIFARGTVLALDESTLTVAVDPQQIPSARGVRGL